MMSMGRVFFINGFFGFFHLVWMNSTSTDAVIAEVKNKHANKKWKRTIFLEGIYFFGKKFSSIQVSSMNLPPVKQICLPSGCTRMY